MNGHPVMAWRLLEPRRAHLHAAGAPFGLELFGLETQQHGAVTVTVKETPFKFQKTVWLWHAKADLFQNVPCVGQCLHRAQWSFQRADAMRIDMQKITSPTRGERVSCSPQLL